MTPRVSVIIPCYNGGRFLHATLESALAQTMADIEVLLVDDGSTDNTKEVADSIADSRLCYLWQSNAGPAAARDHGFRTARGEYLAFLDADDVWLSTMLERCITVLDAAPPEVGTVTTDYRFIGPDGQMLERASGWKPWRGDVFERLLQEIPFVGPGIVWRRECFESIGGFDLTPEMNDDWLNWLRIARKGYLFEAIPEKLVSIRRHDGNITRVQAWRVIQWRLNALDAICREGNVPEDIQARAHAAVYWIGTQQAFTDHDFSRAEEWWLRTVACDPAVLRRDETYYVLILAGQAGGDAVTSSDLVEGWRRADSFLAGAYVLFSTEECAYPSKSVAYARGLLCLARIAYSQERSWLARASFLKALLRSPSIIVSGPGLLWCVRVIAGRKLVRGLRHLLSEREGCGS